MCDFSNHGVDPIAAIGAVDFLGKGAGHQLLQGRQSANSVYAGDLCHQVELEAFGSARRHRRHQLSCRRGQSFYRLRTRAVTLVGTCCAKPAIV